MESFAPDFIVANCPGCAMFMDKWQYAIATLEGRTFDKEGIGIPVLTYEEMAALVLGFDPWETGLQMHQIQCESLLDKMGIPYNPEMKYTGLNGEKIEPPTQPDCFCSKKPQ
jgi:heterodisulfide reductase subunit B